MASSTIPTTSKAAGDLAAVHAFPQLVRHETLPSDRWRALYARATNNRFAFRVLNRRYVQGFRTLEAPKLTEVGRRVAADLQADGIAFAHVCEFFDAAFFATISTCFAEYLDDFVRANPTPSAKGKAVFLDTIHKSHVLVPDDPVSAFLASPELAAIARRYMGMVPRFVGVSFWHTRSAAGDARQFSQLWHRDYNDRMLVKAFLYLSEVGPEQGYFEYVTGSHARGAAGRRFDRIGSDGFRAYPDSATVDQFVAALPVYDLSDVSADRRFGAAAPWHHKVSVVRCIAPRGTLIFADTFGLHRGGFVKSGHRDMIMTTYSTNFNVHKPHFAVSRAFAQELTPFMRMVFGLS
jgi:hypothetical protein